MKKSLIFIAVLAVVAIAATMLTGCTNSVALKGTAWSEAENYVYDVYEVDGGNETVGSLEVAVNKLEKGDEVSIPEIREEAFTVSEYFGNAKITMTAKNTDGVVIMNSVCLINGCTSLASYKKVANGDTNYEVKGYYSDSKYNYSVDGGEWNKIKIKSGFLDNEALYFALRCQDIDSAYSSTYTMVDAREGAKESITVASAAALTLDVKYFDRKDALQTSTQECVGLSVRKTSAPVGTPIYVWYTPYSFSDTSAGFQLSNNQNSSLTSFHIPVRIEEGNLYYQLASVSVNY